MHSAVTGALAIRTTIAGSPIRWSPRVFYKSALPFDDHNCPQFEGSA